MTIMTRPEHADTLVQSVSRALEILDFFAQAPDGVTLSKLCEETGLNSSTAHRLLATLIAYGYIRQNSDTKIYALGSQSLRLGQSALMRIDIRHEALEPLRELVAEVRELANLTVLSGDYAIYVAQVPAEDRTIQMFTRIGAHVPLHCSGVGKAMLAFMPEKDRQRLVTDKPLAAFTVNTITNGLKLHQELEIVKECGYAVDNEEREEGVRCVAAPVFDVEGKVIAAISISGPSGRFPPFRFSELGQLVRQTAIKISKRVGYIDEVS